MNNQCIDELRPDDTKPRPLTYEQARTLTKPRRCNVPWHRLGGSFCCDHCASQAFSVRHVECLSSDEPRLFRPLRH